MTDPIGELAQLVSRLPGIGERTAARLVFFVLNEDPEYASALGSALAAIHERVKRCEVCGNFGSGRLCRICSDPSRTQDPICVVARVQDLMAIERTGAFRGRYHVLHRLLSPLDGVGPEDLPLDALVSRVQTHGVKEVIVATPLSVEGEATALYIAQTIKPLGTTVSRIASGVPHGGEVEYADQVTLGRALASRSGL